MFKDIYKTYRM